MDERLDAIVDILRRNELPVTWKAIIGDPPGAAPPDYDDATWSPGWKALERQRWDTAWVRGAIPPCPLVVGPVEATALVGGLLTVWLDGTQVAEGFEPEFTVANATAGGEPLVIAIRSSDGELSSEMMKLLLFRSERLRQVKTLRRSLDFVRMWRKAQPRHADRIGDVLARYAEAADPAVYKGAPSVFWEDVRAASELLRELDPLAKEYTVHVVPHSHVDLSWGWDFSETKRLGRALFSEALRIMDEDPDYTFAQDQPPMYAHLEGSAMEKAVARRIAEGRWDIPGATFSEPESFMPGGESWARHLLYTKRYFKDRFGKDITIHWAPDNFSGHASTLPQIWKLAGIRAFAFGNWYQADHGGQFLWEGLDGTRVFAHYFTGHYDSAQMIEQDKVIKNVCAHMAATRLPKCMLLDGDDLTPPWPGSPMGIEKLRGLAAFPKIEFSTPHRFFADVDPEAMDLRVVKGEFVSTTGARHNNVGAYTTFAEVKRRNRRCEWALRTTEALATVAMRDGGIYPTKHVARAWRLVLFNQMHDIFPGTAIFEAYDEAFRRYDEVDGICTIGTNAVANVLAAAIDTRGEGTPFVLFNTLGWDRTDPAEITFTEPHRYAEGFRAVDAEGHDVPVQVLSSTIGTFDKTNKTYRVLVQPREVPAMGHAVVWLRPTYDRERSFGSSMVGPDGLALDNDHVRVRIDPRTGWIAEFYDKRLRRSILPDGCKACALEGQNDIGNPWHLVPEGRPWMLDETVRAEVVEDGDVRAAIRVTTTWHRSTFVQEYRLYRNSPRLEVRTEIDCRDANFVCRMLLPVALPPEATWTCEVPWGAVERPIPDNDRATQTWADVSGVAADGEPWGVALLNDGRYGYSRRQDGTMTLTLLRTVVAHLSHDQTDEGRHVVTYAILPHAGTWQDAGAGEAAHALNSPIVANRDIPHEGARPATASVLRVEQPNIVLAALKKAEDDDAWILHLYETAGRATEASVTFDRPVAEAREMDLMEWNAGAELVRSDTTIRRAFRPWEIACVRVRLG